MKVEMKELKTLRTWSYVVVKDEQLKQVLPVKCVYEIKLTGIGDIERLKARLVAKEYK